MPVRKKNYVKIKKTVIEKVEKEITEDIPEEPETSPAEEKVSITDKIKQMISNMFEVEDQKIN